MRVLIVDDDSISLDFLQFALEAAGHDVVTATDGDAALAALGDGRVHVIVSDWEMPGTTGPDLCRAVRAQELGGYVYFILLTARDRAASLVEGLAAGADDFMTKPFDADELAARIRVAERILSLETRDMTIFSLAKLAESRDPETGHHLERVQGYSRLLAWQLFRTEQFPDEVDAGFVNLIYETSPLHDIGKVAIPDAVLLKPGSLSNEEFAVMKTHTTLGARTLDAALDKFPTARYLKIAREIAASHHEKWDGSGYPLGLKGESIPLAGRIVAVADVYDALVSRRVYKAAFTHDAARKVIVDGRGKHFDPAVVDAFLAVEFEFIAVQQKFAADEPPVQKAA